MSGKRQAETDLNHDNWDQEEESSEVGEFQKAPAEEIQKRIIKTAKRRLADNQSETKSIFGNFAGFKSFTSNTNASAPFLFSATSINGSGSLASSANMPSSEPLKKTEPTPGNSKSPKYCAELKALNEQLLDWIKTHLTKNPVCILTPIFKDYEKYIRNIEDEDNNEKSASKKSKISFTAPTSVSDVKESNKSIESSPTTTTKTTSNSIFGNISANIFTNVVSNPSSKASADLSAAPTTIATTTSGATKFSFGDLSSNTLTSPSFGKAGGFTFGTASAPFTFSNVTQSSTSESQTHLEDEEPPKVEFTPVVEEDSKFSKRVKVFFKQDDSYSDRGVGTLYIKEVEAGAKSQLLVRADTNLGNILLNILLTEGIPLRRLGTNNVMLCCIPTPDAQPPPKSVLLRVKTAAEADELLETIKKYQK